MLGTLMLVFLALVMILVISIAWTIPRGAPWVPTSLRMVHQMLQLADLQPGELVYDLGCGDGRILIAAARDFQARAVGIEIDPLRYLWCRILITVFGLRERVKLIYGDLFQVDLSRADVVTCYLLPEANLKLEDKLLGELRPGTRVVSNTFLFNQVQIAEQDGKARLYIFSPENTVRESLKKQLQAPSRG
jgi:SAM-dependent methyltransferase